MKKLFLIVSVIFLVVNTQACMTYRNYPLIDGPLRVDKKDASLAYRVDGGALFAGPSAIRDVLLTESQYSKFNPVESAPSRGDFLNVKIEQTSPSVSAVVFGYVSYATLTFLPFWSNNDGSILTFTFYRDGTQIDSKEYVINRGTFVWIGMIPFAWVNFLTPSEADAFQSCTRDFLQGMK